MDNALRLVAALGGLLLFVIGVRFLITPDDAAYTFGLAPEIAGYDLHYIVALRDLWLGALAIAFAALKEWRALALWFGFGAFVCFADAGIAAQSSGATLPLLFHSLCGVACVALAVLFAKSPRA